MKECVPVPPPSLAEDRSPWRAPVDKAESCLAVPRLDFPAQATGLQDWGGVAKAAERASPSVPKWGRGEMPFGNLNKELMGEKAITKNEHPGASSNSLSSSRSTDRYRCFFQ